MRRVANAAPWPAALAAAAMLASAAFGAVSRPLVIAFALPGQHVRFVDSSGKQVGSARLPQPPRYAVPTSVPGRAIVVGENGAISIVDARAAKVIAVRVPPGGNEMVLSSTFSGARRYVVLGDNGGANELLDVQTGKTEALAQLHGAQQIFGGTFSPDGRTLLALGSSTSWLVPAADASRAASVPRQWVGGSFSPDGRTVAFVDVGNRQHHRIALADASGSNHREFDPGVPALALAQFLPDGRLLVVGTTEVAVVDADGKNRKQIATVGGFPLRMVVDPGGHGALIGAATRGSNDANRWTWVDLHGASHLVTALNGLGQLPATVGGRFAYFVDNPQPGPGGRRIAVIDLASGAAHTALRIRKSAHYYGAIVGNNGRGVLAASSTGSTERLFLVTPSGAPRLVGAAATVNGAFSRDGSWIAVSARAPGRKPGKLRLLPVAGGPAANAGTGDLPVWVP